jgi:DNA-binding transcriptional MerR regulator
VSGIREPAEALDATRRTISKAAGAFRTISEVADELDVPQHVLRFWETKFLQIRPLKRGGGRRYYRPEDVELLRRIGQLLYREGYTIKGVQRLLREGQLRSEPKEYKDTPLPLGLEEPEPELMAVPDEHDAAPSRRRSSASEVEQLRSLLSDVLEELEQIRDLLERS